MDLNKVIYLGHSAKEPLMCPPSELAYGSEPHDHIWSMVHRGVQSGTLASGEVGVPGVVQLGGYREVAIPGTNPGSSRGRFYGLFMEY